MPRILMLKSCLVWRKQKSANFEGSRKNLKQDAAERKKWIWREKGIVEYAKYVGIKIR